MASTGLNKWIVSGRLAADAQLKTVSLRNGEQAQIAEATMYVRKSRNWKESFTVRISVWDNSAAWRKRQFLTKGSLLICTGTVEPNPYLSKSDNTPRAGLEMTVLDIDIDLARTGDEDEDASTPSEQPAVPVGV